ncbi:hypothetical protein NK6_2988 [Bradyrhizobium diazoefficiens]|uniref:Uncharacterized protein n=1 Tax=Bradyrhizobium diazoefficiens TaxID=1355477 RepID=A0A0E4FSI2_9BRAD|nr:hypothetical protein NK6_2988 [Bradyrhizobium diazoefficiens]
MPLGAKTKFNDIQVLEAQRELAARGLTKNQVMGMMEPAAQLGMSMDLSLGELHRPPCARADVRSRRDAKDGFR